MATARARTSAKWPSSTVIAAGSSSRRRFARVSGLLQRRGNLRRHIVFVVLGEHLGSRERAVGAERSLHDHALPLAEQVGQNTGIVDGHGAGGVGHAEADAGGARVALDAAGFDEATPPDALAGCDLLRPQFGGREEEDAVARASCRERVWQYW